MDDIIQWTYEIRQSKEKPWIARNTTTVGYVERNDMRDYLIQMKRGDLVRNIHDKHIGKDI